MDQKIKDKIKEIKLNNVKEFHKSDSQPSKTYKQGWNDCLNKLIAEIEKI